MQQLECNLATTASGWVLVLDNGPPYRWLELHRNWEGDEDGVEQGKGWEVIEIGRRVDQAQEDSYTQFPQYCFIYLFIHSFVCLFIY